MNILPKKSWHVRTRKNIEKVRKDEKDAADRERERLERIAVAERESRTAFLRQKTGAASSFPASGKADIFDGVQRGKGDNRKNREREKEEKVRTEDWEQKVGILTYLHKKDADIDQPWYLQPHENRMSRKDEPEGEKRREEAKLNDPLFVMKKYCDQMKKQPSDGTKSKSAHRKEPISTHQRPGNGKRAVQTEEEGNDSDSKCKLQKLRDERLRRETRERDRALKLVSGGRTPGRTPACVDERYCKFNSQFNPQLARH